MTICVTAYGTRARGVQTAAAERGGQRVGGASTAVAKLFYVANWVFRPIVTGHSGPP